MKAIKRFETGKSYFMRSTCDYNCIWVYTIVKRTESTITIKDEDGKVKTCRINKGLAEMYNAEAIYPLGKYSLCPVLRAERLYK